MLFQADYDKSMKTYYSSPAYISYLAAKSKAKVSKCQSPSFMCYQKNINYILATAEAESHETPSRPSKASQQDRRIDIQPAEDEDGIFLLFK